MATNSKRLLWAGLVVAVIGGAYGVTALRGNGVAFEPSRLAKAERGTMTRSVVATGKIEPISQVEVKSKANGIIEALYVDVGDVVKPGQVLAELDKEQLQARMREASANLLAAEAAHRAAEAQLAKSQVEAEGPEVEFARRAQARAADLFEQKLIAPSVLDEARSAWEQAENRQRAAKSALGIARANVAEASAKVAQARAAAERAREELANSTLRSPIRGIVLTRDVEIGSPVSSILNLGANATLVMRLGDVERVFVRGKVDEADIGRVREGQPAKITVETFKDRSFEGTVTQISPMGMEKDNVTTFEVEVSIRNPGNELKANMTANAEIVLEQFPNSLLVPESAVGYDQQRQPYVDVPDPTEDSGRRRVPVKLGVGNGTKTQITSGLKEGDTVILPG
jgi:HlyD family secretion protein